MVSFLSTLVKAYRKLENKIKILFAEDSLGWRNVITTCLHSNPKYNIEVIAEAGNGLELIEKLKKCKPDVILLDLEMPEMDGNTTLDYLNQEHPELKVIIISFYSGEYLREDYHSRGVKAYLSKDQAAEIPDLVSIIKKVHSGKTVIGNYEKPKFTLSEKQKDIVQLQASGKTPEEIGKVMGITTDAVRKHIKKVVKKMGFISVSLWIKDLAKGGLEFLRKPRRDSGCV